MDKKLAIHGGIPVRNQVLPYGRQFIDEEDIKAVVDTLKSSYLTCGPQIDEFEKRVAEYVGAKYAVAVNSGTAALHSACFAAGINVGDEVITTPITFAASANCVLYMGGNPVFADIQPETYNIDPFEIEKMITPKTKAIIPVDFTGEPVNLDAIADIAKRHGLIVIEDAAHALGAEYRGKRIGSISDMTIFSFHPVKHITTGEGGMITTNNPEYYEKLRAFRTHGITRNEDKLTMNEGPWYYEMQDLGYNYRITDIQASLGITQLSKLQEFLKRRREIISIYNNEFSKIDGIKIKKQIEGVSSAGHLYILNLEPEKLGGDRKQIFEALKAEGIGVNVHYIPVYLHPYYKKLGFKKGLCPEAEKLYENIISIPLFYSMTDEDINDVVNAVKKVIDYYRKV